MILRCRGSGQREGEEEVASPGEWLTLGTSVQPAGGCAKHRPHGTLPWGEGATHPLWVQVGEAPAAATWILAVGRH